MHSFEKISTLVKELDREEYKILKIFVSSIKNHENIKNTDIASYSRLHQNIVDFRLNKLLKNKLIKKTKNGYKLVFSGLDVFALKILVDKDIIFGLGKPLGIGKESDVIESITSNRHKRAIKFYRIGRISFRDTKRKRSFEKKRTSHNWFLININAAKREYDILLNLKNSEVNCCIPFYRSMHTIVMEKIEGKMMIETTIIEPEKLLDDIIHQLKITYDNGIINGDISEYNILIDNKFRPWIIDWPQAVSTNHPDAKKLIKRDVYNIVKYFNKKYKLGKDYENLLNKIV
ncbi:MAG: RIO1 family regulatory kinase/ATPase [Nitrososphaeraceae archaeon]